MEQQVKVWGVRGSMPQPGPAYLQYGGHTACISLEREGELAVLDAGSGLSCLAKELEGKALRRLDLFLSHPHFDHMMGLFTFPLLHDPGMELHLYGGTGLQKNLETLIDPPYWPVGMRDCEARLFYHELRPGEQFRMGSFRGTVAAGNHPGGSLVCRLEADGKSLVYTLDCETDEAMFARLTEFSRGADLIVWDASYTRADKRPGWGHSTWEEGIALRRAAGAGRVLMSHYSPDYTDPFLQEQELEAQRADRTCIFAREGMVLDL